MAIIWDRLNLKMHEVKRNMNDIKDYRNNELKNYVIGNILLMLLFSGLLEKFFTQEISNNLSIWGTVIESALLSSIIYIYVFLLDSLIPGNIKQNLAYFHIGKLPGYTIFTDMQIKVKDDRFNKSDVLKKYDQVYHNMPTDKKEREKYQNSQWYKIYCSCKNDSKILIANRDFLLCRDITIITMMLIVLYLIFCFFKIVVLSEKVVLILIAELIVSDISMRGKAKRLAYNVISEDIYK